MCARIIDQKVLFTYFGCQRFSFCCTSPFIMRIFHEIADIACPASKVNIVGIVERHVKRTEHMRKISRIAIRQHELRQAPQRLTGISFVHFILLSNIVYKVRVWCASHDIPFIGRIFFNAGTDIVDDKQHGISAVLLSKRSCIDFKLLQTIHKALIAVDANALCYSLRFIFAGIKNIRVFFNGTIVNSAVGRSNRFRGRLKSRFGSYLRCRLYIRRDLRYLNFRYGSGHNFVIRHIVRKCRCRGNNAQHQHKGEKCRKTSYGFLTTHLLFPRFP